MKPKTIIGLIVMVGFASLLLLNFGEQVGGYMGFEEAAETGARAHVVGQWVEDRQTHYDPTHNVFSFYMKDDQGVLTINVRSVLGPMLRSAPPVYLPDALHRAAQSASICTTSTSHPPSQANGP